MAAIKIGRRIKIKVKTYGKIQLCTHFSLSRVEVLLKHECPFYTIKNNSNMSKLLQCIFSINCILKLFDKFYKKYTFGKEVACMTDKESWFRLTRQLVLHISISTEDNSPRCTRAVHYVQEWHGRPLPRTSCDKKRKKKPYLI